MMLSMEFWRAYEPTFAYALTRPYVQILFGARQVGKSTLVRSLLPSPDLELDFADPAQRTRYLSRPERLSEELRALLTTRSGLVTCTIDEAQNVPSVFDAVQHFHDRNSARLRVVLTGSSARRLRRTGANLLPGRAMLHRLHPLTLAERPDTAADARIRGMILPPDGPDVAPVQTASSGSPPRRPPFPAVSLLDRLTFGDLPGIAVADRVDRPALLRAYAELHLEEEIRREALVKDWGAFARFIRLAALASGEIVNYSSIAQEAGLSVPTVKNHYGLLEDLFLGFPVEAFSGSGRKVVLSTPRFLFFDLGVRHAAAGLANSTDTVLAHPGPIFEQWVGLELYRHIALNGRGKLMYLRTKGGMEIDYLVDTGDEVIPIEVKWTENPTLSDARHLTALLKDPPPRIRRGFVVCRCTRPTQLSDHVMAIPHWAL